jgi:serine protease
MDPWSHGAHARRLLAATLAAAAVALTSLVLHADIVVPPNGKARLLSQSPREAIVRDALRTRAPRPIDRSLYVPGHVVVKFAPGTTERAMSAIARDVGARAMRRPSYADFTYVELPADVDVETAARALASMPGVIYAEPDARVFTTFTPNDPLYDLQWNFQKLDMDRTWDINRGGESSIVVAVIDSGVAYLTKGPVAQAPELTGTKFVPGYDFVWDDNEPVDLDGHGTHVSGTIAQVTNNNVGTAGMAFNVTIMPIKAIAGEWDIVFDAPYPFGASTVARAIRFAADNGAKVLNMSFGSFAPNTATLEAMQYAVDKGVFMAIAAGNEGNSDNAPSWPAVYAKDMDGAMAVGAVDYALNRAYYSNSNDYVEIAAPGGDVTADLDHNDYGDGVLQQTMDPDAVAAGVFDDFGYIFEQGTSMATPHVAAFAALLMDQGVTNPQAIEAAIKRFATDIGPKGRDNDTGFGLLNPRATIRGLGLRR